MAAARKRAASSKEQTVLKAWYIRKDQYDFLRWRAYEEGVNQSESIREALDLLIAKVGWAPPRRQRKQSEEPGA